jgi:hypothetical protein
MSLKCRMCRRTVFVQPHTFEAQVFKGFRAAGSEHVKHFCRSSSDLYLTLKSIQERVSPERFKRLLAQFVEDENFHPLALPIGGCAEIYQARLAGEQI